MQITATARRGAARLGLGGCGDICPTWVDSGMDDWKRSHTNIPAMPCRIRPVPVLFIISPYEWEQTKTMLELQSEGNGACGQTDRRDIFWSCRLQSSLDVAQIFAYCTWTYLKSLQGTLNILIKLTALSSLWPQMSRMNQDRNIG